jgi:hypothetical protein
VRFCAAEVGGAAARAARARGARAKKIHQPSKDILKKFHPVRRFSKASARQRTTVPILQEFGGKSTLVRRGGARVSQRALEITAFRIKFWLHVYCMGRNFCTYKTVFASETRAPCGARVRH